VHLVRHARARPARRARRGALLRAAGPVADAAGQLVAARPRVAADAGRRVHRHAGRRRSARRARGVGAVAFGGTRRRCAAVHCRDRGGRRPRRRAVRGIAARWRSGRGVLANSLALGRGADRRGVARVARVDAAARTEPPSTRPRVPHRSCHSCSSRGCAPACSRSAAPTPRSRSCRRMRLASTAG